MRTWSKRENRHPPHFFQGWGEVGGRDLTPFSISHLSLLALLQELNCAIWVIKNILKCSLHIITPNYVAGGWDQRKRKQCSVGSHLRASGPGLEIQTQGWQESEEGVQTVQRRLRWNVTHLLGHHVFPLGPGWICFRVTDQWACSSSDLLKWSEVAQSCLTLCDPMDCSLPGSSVHGIFQARVLEWGAISFADLLRTPPILHSQKIL